VVARRLNNPESPLFADSANQGACFVSAWGPSPQTPTVRLVALVRWLRPCGDCDQPGARPIPAPPPRRPTPNPAPPPLGSPPITTHPRLRHPGPAQSRLRDPRRPTQSRLHHPRDATQSRLRRSRRPANPGFAHPGVALSWGWWAGGLVGGRAGCSDYASGVDDELGAQCSAKGCRAAAVWALRWNNPKIHAGERRKVWLACDDHRESLGAFLEVRGFLREVTAFGAIS
jgi:hypothetical protein